MKPSSRSNEPGFRSADSKRLGDEQPREKLIADKRAGLTPTDLVEQRLQVMLRCPAGVPRLCPPRGDGRTNRTIEYTPARRTEEGTSRREANLDRDGTRLYAVSIEHSLAAEILTGLRPVPCCFWQTDHRGLLLIHSYTRKPARGASASNQGGGRNALVGVVELVDCIISDRAGFDADEIEYHWVLVNPRVFTPPLPYAGRTGLFLVSEGVVEAALRQVRTSKQPRG
ncbi:MAG: ASCH domain-containing protein [Gemmataceae bacterium]